jgi:hypothetical protein
MLPRDKYTMFDRKAKRYRKGIHSMLFLLNRKGVACVQWLTFRSRTPQVDACVAESQPARLLDDGQRWFWPVYPLYYTNWNKRRYGGITMFHAPEALSGQKVGRARGPVVF